MCLTFSVFPLGEQYHESFLLERKEGEVNDPWILIENNTKSLQLCEALRFGTLVQNMTVWTNILSIHSIGVDIFNLMVALKEISGDHLSQYDSSSVPHECLHKISCQPSSSGMWWPLAFLCLLLHDTESLWLLDSWLGRKGYLNVILGFGNCHL